MGSDSPEYVDAFPDWVKLKAALKWKDDKLITEWKEVKKNTKGGDPSCRKDEDVGKRSG